MQEGTEVTMNKRHATQQETSSVSHDDPTDSVPQVPTFTCMKGMMDDLKARAPYYLDDWKKPTNLMTVANAVVYAFMVQLIPALIFAEMLDRETEGKLAVAETLMSTGIIGIIYAIFSGQPLVIMGVTGPVAILLGTSYRISSELFDVDYFAFFWWTCFWAGILHMVSAMAGVVNFVWHITPFTLQIFELFIASAFIYSSIRDLLSPIKLIDASTSAEEQAEALAGLVIGLATAVICWVLHFADTWSYWTRQMRTLLASYNMVVSLVIVTSLSYLPGLDQGGKLSRVNIRVTPWNWQPTYDRAWWVNPTEGIDINGIFGAMFPGLMFYLLFFIDHNVSSILSQLPKFNLKKPPAYHWDFFVLGVTFLPCAFLGLPPGNGLIPQAPLHTRSLCTKEYREIDGVKREVYTHCEEQRYSGLLQAVLMFVVLALLTVISWIPVGALFGVLLYLGCVAMNGNAVWERIGLNAIMPKKRPPVPVVTSVKSWRTVQLYTFVQVGCTAVIFGVSQYASVGYIFPALIAALVPFRTYLVSRMFDEDDLVYLDPMDEAFTPPGGQTHNDVMEENQSGKGSQVSDVPVVVQGMSYGHGLDDYNTNQHSDAHKTM